MNPYRFMTPRWIAALIYAVYAVAGCAFLFFGPATELLDLLGPVGFRVWNTLLILGGTIGLVGALFQQPRIELIGTPGVAAGLLVYSFFLMSEFQGSTAPGLVMGFAMICLGAGLGAADRGWSVWHVLSIRERTSNIIREGD